MYSEVFDILVAECSAFRMVKNTPAESIVGGATHIRHKVRKIDLENIFAELSDLKPNTWYKIYLSFVLVNISGAAYRSIVPLYRSGQKVTNGINVCPYWASESFVEFESTYQYEPLNLYVGESTGNLMGSKKMVDQHILMEDPLSGLLYSSIGQLPLVKPKTANTHDRFRQNLQPSSPSQLPTRQKLTEVVTPVSKRVTVEAREIQSEKTFSPSIGEANLLSKKSLGPHNTSSKSKKKREDVEDAMSKLSEMIVERTKAGADHYSKMIDNMKIVLKSLNVKSTPDSHPAKLEKLLNQWNIHRGLFYQEFKKFDQFTKRILNERYPI